MACAKRANMKPNNGKTLVEKKATKGLTGLTNGTFNANLTFG